MHFVTVIYFCILYSYALAGWPQSAHKWSTTTRLPEGRKALKELKGTNNGNDELNVKQYLAEVAAGDLSEFLGSNVHIAEPHYYKDLSRRFVAVYPYKNKVKHQEMDADDILQYIKSPKKVKKGKNGEIIPIRAPPELVLAVMKNAKKIAKSNPNPSDPTEEVIRQYMLRSGDYWNDVLREEVDPDGLSLRTKKHHKETSDESKEGLFLSSEPVSAKLRPGTKLYSLIAEIVKKAPKLMYIINDK